MPPRFGPGFGPRPNPLGVARAHSGGPPRRMQPTPPDSFFRRERMWEAYRMDHER